MNRIYTLLLLLPFGISAAFANQPTGIADYSAAYNHKVRKADGLSSLEGTWRFTFGDYYYEESEMATVEGEYEAGFYNGFLYFEDDSMEFLPMAASFNEETNQLTFNAGYFGDFGGYGILVQHPSVYDADNHRFVHQSITATFDPETKKITFPANSGMNWWLYDYDYQTPIIEIWGYTFEGAVKVSDADFEYPYSAHQIVINKGSDNEMTIKFSDFTRIDFKDGNMILDTEDGLAIPLVDLATIHFEENNKTLSVASPVEEAVTLNYQNGSLWISGLTEAAPLNIYSLNGAKVVSISAYDGQPVDVSSLSPGVYVVNSGRHSFKIIK